MKDVINTIIKNVTRSARMPLPNVLFKTSTLKTLSLGVFVSALISSFTLSTASANPGNRLGYNTSGLHSIASSNPFIDIFKISRGWITACEFDWQRNRPIDPGCTRKTSFNTKESDKVSVDANGWPTRLPARGERPVFTSISAIWDMPDNFPTGQYFMTYEGDADLKVLGDVDIIQQRKGRVDFNLKTAKRNLRIHITRINPRNHIRNIKVIPKKYAGIYKRQKFNPDYIRSVRPFNSIRFMPWQNTKDTIIKNWRDRTTPQSAFYNGNAGVPVETMTDLANTAHAAPWFSMPHMATDSFMRRFAQTVKQRLKPGQKVYVEYSNEVWNSMYPATHYASQQGLKLWPRGKTEIKNPGTRRLYLALNYNAKRSKEMCNIWKQTFGGQRRNVVCVVSAYGSAPKMGEELMTCPLAGGDCYKHFDAYAVAPYFGDYIARIENRPLVKRWARQGKGGVNQLFREILNGGLAKDNYKGGAIENAIQDRVVKNVALARKYGVKLLAYEGGQHLLRVDRPHVIHDPKVRSLFAKANRHPQMGTAYLKFLNAWNRAGGGMLMHFNGISAMNDRNIFPMLDKPGGRSAKYNAMISYLRGR